MMKRFFIIVMLGFFASGCLALRPPKAAGLAEGALPSYSGPKAKVAVVDFDVQAPKATAAIGTGLREIMASALINSGHFIVAPKQTADANIKDADLIISTAVTEFEPQASGGSAGVGGGGGANSGAFGGLLGTALNKAHIALEVRIINASTSEVLSSMRVQGQALDASGGPGSGSANNWALGSGLSVYNNTPMEKAIRVCMIEAVRYVGQAVDGKYYKYQ